MISTQQIQESRILLIDDTVTNIQMLVEMLEQLGYPNVKGLTDARLATETFSEYKPDLVVLDIMMPYLDGFEVMRQFKALDPESAVPILVLTASSDQVTRLRALESGGSDFLVKPFDIMEVSLRIRNLLQVRALNKSLVEHIHFLEKVVRERSVDLLTARELLVKEKAQYCGDAESAELQTG
jgi:putative two-component system response regulator